MRQQGLEDFEQQTDRVISHHDGNDRRDNRIKPVKALRHVDDSTGHGDSRRSRGVAGGIKKDGTHVQIAAEQSAAFTPAAHVVAIGYLCGRSWVGRQLGHADSQEGHPDGGASAR